MSGDTVYVEKEKWHIKYVDKINLDTVYLASNDTSVVTNTITLPPEKYVPKWLKIMLCITGGITLFVAIKFGIKIYLTFLGK